MIDLCAQLGYNYIISELEVSLWQIHLPIYFYWKGLTYKQFKSL